jgi:hypothetical protein
MFAPPFACLVDLGRWYIQHSPSRMSELNWTQVPALQKHPTPVRIKFRASVVHVRYKRNGRRKLAVVADADFTKLSVKIVDAGGH